MKKYQIKPACFLCNTPFQLINSIAIVQEKQLEADIYIFGMFDGYKRVADKLKKYNIFSRVISVDCTKFSNLSEKRAFSQCLFTKKVVSDFLGEGIAYQKLFVSSRMHIKQIFQHEMQRRNKDLKIIIFEDGLGTYEKSSSVLNTSLKRKMVELLLNWHLFEQNNTSVLVSRPELLELPVALSSVPVKKMPSFAWNQSNKNMVLDIFTVTQNDLIKEPVILFDPTRGTYVNDLGVQIDKLDQCYNIFFNVFKKENVICKPHPRSKIKTSVQLKLYERTEIPMEVLYSGMDNLENRILVGNWSTALYTPKMLFDKEPVIIDLHKLLYKEDFHIASSLYKKMHTIYDNQSRIMAPKSFEELHTICQHLANVLL